MKKLLSLALVSCIAFSLAACGGGKGNGETAQTTQESESSEVSEAPAEETAQPEPTEEPTEEPTPEVSTEQLEAFKEEATIAETVMVDEDGIKITATGLEYTGYTANLNVTIENNSKKDLSFVSGSLGYSCNSVNGYMVSDGYLNCDVAKGKKSNETITFSYDSLRMYGINEIADIEVGFDMSDADYKHTYTGPRQVKTSIYDAHDYSGDCYQDTITSQACMNTFDYEMKNFSKDPLYEANGVKLLSSTIMTNSDGDTMLLLEIENTTSDIVYVVSSDVTLNGLLVSSGVYSSSAINPGKRGMINIGIATAFDPKYQSALGINEIGSIGFSLTQNNAAGKTIADAAPVEIAIPNVQAVYDATGTEVYNKDGLRIVSKGVSEDSSETGSDICLLLLAENKSGKTLDINEVYDSLSVNGYMTDFLYDNTTVKNEQSAVLQVKMQESSLEENEISSPSDVKDVEIGFEICKGSKTIDEPTLKISLADNAQ